MSKQPLVSIILPTHNGASTIRHAIASVQAQDYSHWELLILDDGSTDTTAAVITDCARFDDRIRYLKNEQNRGLQKTLNRGLQEARGELIARIDDDDMWSDSSKLSHQVLFFQEHPTCVLLGTGAQVINAAGEFVTRYQFPQTDQKLRRMLLSRNCFIHSSVMMRAKTVIAAGGYPEDTHSRHVEDYALWLAVGAYGTIHNLPTYSVTLVQHAGSISFNNKLFQFKRGAALTRRYKDNYPSYVLSRMRFAAKIIVYQCMMCMPPVIRVWLHRIVYRCYMR